MMVCKNASAIITTLCLIFVATAAFGLEIEYGPADTVPDFDIWNLEESSSDSGISIPIPLIEVMPETGAVGLLEEYKIDLTVPEGDIPNMGGISFRFPYNFSVAHIVDIEYADNDPGPDLVPYLAFIYNQQVTVFFEPGLSPPAGTVITLTIRHIENPTVSGTYQVSGLIFNSLQRVVAGPTVSEDFEIYPDQPVELSIVPGEPQFLTAGNSLLFSAVAHDIFGNEVTGLNYTWSLSSEYDDIGSLTNGYLFATSAGTGQVVVTYGSLAAESGLITVTPGEIEYFQIDEYPQTVNAGEVFPSPVIVSGYDSFGNLKTDYMGSVYFESTDPKAVFYYDESNKYQFTSNDSGSHEFAGGFFTLNTQGKQTITITDGEVSGSSGNINVKGGLVAVLSYVENSLAPTTVYNGSAWDFMFDIKLDGNSTIQLDRFASRLELHYDDNFVAGYLADAYVLQSGFNRIHTADIFMPDELIGLELTPLLVLKGTEFDTPRTDTISFGEQKILVSDKTEIEPRVKINSTEILAINSPYVNYGQDFSIKVAIENLSDFTIDSISIFIQSEDGSITYAEAHDITLSPIGTLDTSFELTAPEFSAPTIIYKSVITTPSATVLPPDDNTASITVQSPARIDLSYTLNNASGNFVDYNKPFSIDVRMINTGEALAGIGEISLIVDEYDFGVPDSSSISLGVSEIGTWQLVAPAMSIETSFRLRITGIPLDINTGLPALPGIDSVSIPITVELSFARLIVGGIAAQAPLIMNGATKEIFELNFLNDTENPLNVIGINSITVGISDRYDNLVSPERVLVPELSGVYRNNQLISEGSLADNRLRFDFSDFELSVGDVDTVVVKAAFADEINIENFNLTVDSRDIDAVYADGPRINQSVSVLDDEYNIFRLKASFVVVGRDFQKSLMVRNNPFNPDEGPAEIAYYLDRDRDIYFTVYTLTGEKVFEQMYRAGSESGSAGDNIIYWSGRNDENLPVLNGVYVAVIKAGDGDESYRLKIAVMR